MKPSSPVHRKRHIKWGTSGGLISVHYNCQFEFRDIALTHGTSDVEEAQEAYIQKGVNAQVVLLPLRSDDGNANTSWCTVDVSWCNTYECSAILLGYLFESIKSNLSDSRFQITKY